VPIYEFYCSRCHRVFNFLSRRVNTEGAPACPRCGLQDLQRRVSAFAISKGRKEPEKPAETPGADPFAGMDEGKLMRVMEELGPEAEKLGEDDPRGAARLMRRLFAATGMPVQSGMEEALRRMEAGEDPEKVEEEMGDVLEQDPFGSEPGQGEPLEQKRALASLRRRLPPPVDATLYEM
jgi:putative FmdB family regulatory protein